MELLSYKLVGNGPEKVFVMHNWFGDKSSYDHMAPYLDEGKFTYIFVDLRGYGSSKKLQGQYSSKEAAQDIINLADSLSCPQFHVIGHSMSGMIAQQIALDHFARVKSVIAITPVPASGSPAPADLMAFMQDAARNNDDNAVNSVQMLTSHHYSLNFAKKMVAHWRANSDVAARLGYLEMFSNTDFSSAVKGLTTPMLVLYGEWDFEGGETLMRSTFLAWYPKAELDRLPSAGHYPMQETPVYLASRIEQFLAAQNT